MLWVLSQKGWLLGLLWRCECPVPKVMLVCPWREWCQSAPEDSSCYTGIALLGAIILILCMEELISFCFWWYNSIKKRTIYFFISEFQKADVFTIMGLIEQWCYSPIHLVWMFINKKCIQEAGTQKTETIKNMMHINGCSAPLYDIMISIIVFFDGK